MLRRFTFARSGRLPRTVPRAHTPRVRTRIVAALAAALWLGAGCGGSALTDTPDIAEVALTPPTATVEAGRTLALSARVTDVTGATVTSSPVAWSSSNPQVATVSAAGLVTARATGEARIAASAGGRSAVASITVTEREAASVQLLPVTLSIRVNRTAPLLARVLDADGTLLEGRPVSWSSSNTAVATVNAQGIVSAIAPGAATITATSAGRSAQSAVTVTPEPVAAVSVAPARDTLLVGTNRALTATVRDEAGAILTGRAVTWSVGSPAVATVSSTGVVTALTTGTTTVLAVSEGRVGQATITVVARLADAITLTPAVATVQIGSTTLLLAQVTDPVGNLLPDRTVTFSSDNPAVAAVASTGLVTARAQGVARITATSEGKVATAVITVVPVPVAVVSIIPDGGDLVITGSRALVAEARAASGELITGRPVTWTSGAPGVATVDASGILRGLSAGQVVVAATVDGVSGFATFTVRAQVISTVTIAPAAPSVAVGASVQLSATPRDPFGTPVPDLDVTWTSANEAVAFISSTGLVVGVSPGTAVITATSGGVSATTIVTVR